MGDFGLLSVPAPTHIDRRSQAQRKGKRKMVISFTLELMNPNA